MRINTNIAFLSAQDSSRNASKKVSSSLEQLSSGLRIHKASDNASGLAIADKLRTQVTSIKQGVDNANYAITLLQIADKSMAEQSNILDIVKAKLIQANSDSTSDDGRSSILKDIKKLLTQFDTIAAQTNYNGRQLIASEDGSSAASALKFQIGGRSSDIISTSSIQASTSGVPESGDVVAQSEILLPTVTQWFTDNLTQNFTLSYSNKNDSINITGKEGVLTNTGANVILVEGVSVNSGDSMALPSNYTSASIMPESYPELISYEITAIDLTEVKTNGSEATVTWDYSPSGNFSGGTNLSALKSLGSLSKADSASYQNIVDDSLSKLNEYRSEIGSTQNQVESAMRNLMTQATNIEAAESIIRDVDYAKESSTFNKQNIVSQAGSYAISQANSISKSVLQFLN